MIRWLKAVIARLSGTKVDHTETTALPTQTAGLVPQEPTTKPGKKRTALATNAPTDTKPKRSRARQTTAEASPKQERTTAKRTAIQVGQQQATPALQTQQPAKRGRKPKQKAAK